MSDDTHRPRRTDRHRRPARLHTPQEIRGLEPAATTRDATAQSLRPRKRSAALDPRTRRRRRGRIAIIAAAVVLVLLVAGGAWALTFIDRINSKIHAVTIKDPALAAAIVHDTPPPGDPFFILLMGDDRRPGETQARSDTLIVARIDPKRKIAQMVSILRDSRVDIPGHGSDKINAAPEIGGPELALKTVRQLTGLPISRYLTVDFSGFRQIVDSMGGVWIDVPVAIDDTPAGKADTAWDKKNRIIPKGLHKLSGYQALTFVRARHQFADQDFSRVKDQQLFIKALAKQVLQISNVFRAPQIISAIADHIRTNMTLSDLTNLVMQMKGMKESDMQSATMPGTAKYINGLSYVVIDDVAMHTLLGRMSRGEDLQPAAPSKSASATPAAIGNGTAPAIAPTSVSITIRNGAGVSGLAKQASTFFTSRGFKIHDSGNANQFVYGQTLIVYKTATVAKAAAVADALGYGKVVPASGMFTFDGDILVVIGKDWKDPSSTTSP